MRERLAGIQQSAHGPRFMRFAVVGVLNTGIDYFVFLTLLRVFDVPLLLANAIGMLCGSTNSYLINKFWTFKDPTRGRANVRRFAIFLACNVASLGIGSAVIWLLVFVLPAELAKIGSISVTMCFNYWSSHRFVYRTR